MMIDQQEFSTFLLKVNIPRKFYHRHMWMYFSFVQCLKKCSHFFLPKRPADRLASHRGPQFEKHCSEPSKIQTFSSSPCSQKSSIYVLPRMWEIKTTLYYCVWIFKVFKHRTGRQKIRRMDQLLISSWMLFWFVAIVPKYFNFATLSDNLLATATW
jgi:hypothetical protein